MMAALLAAVAAALLVPTDPLRRLRGGHGSRARLGPRRVAIGLAIALVGAASLAILGLRPSGWLAICGVVGGTALLVVRSGIRRRRARAAAAETAQVARLLASLLHSGVVPAGALALAAEDFPALRPAATAVTLGGAPAAELTLLARSPGCEGYSMLGAAWHVAHRSGAPVADVLADLSQRLRQERTLHSTIEQELSTARASGQIMAALPAGAVMLGTAVGADPLGLLVTSPLGELLILIGVTLTAAGILWIDRLASPPRWLR